MKMRAWWNPQVGSVSDTFIVPVNSLEEAKKVMDILAAYDVCQYNNRIRADFANTGGVEMWNEEDQEWEDWFYDEENSYYDNVDQYCEEKSEHWESLKEFSDEIFSHVDFDDWSDR